MTAPIGLFYGSSTCYTEIAAEKIRDHLGPELVDVHNIAEVPVSLMADYSRLILGIPTWDYGELQEDWETVWDDLDAVDFAGKTVALYGLGDQDGYPEWFQDAMGFLWAKVVNGGARTIGYWPIEGYRFEDCKALTADGDYFVGLALDEENEFDLSDERLARWCQQIIAEFDL
ncbi:MAG: flavodoxin [Porticoccaceae bacterium]|nr:flavodoxin [Porticoccaceae bacterium]